VQLRDLAEIRVIDGPPMIKSENGRLTGWVYITIDSNDIGGYVERAKEALYENMDLPVGYTINWAGQYQYMMRAKERLTYVIPLTLFIICILLYLSFRNIYESLMVMLAVPLALIGGVWLLWFMNFNLSIAVAVGFIALAGVAAEFGVVMIIYLREAIQRHQPKNEQQLREAVIDGAIMRVRPKAMTAAVIIIGLMPILLGSGAGSEVMQRIAAPMIGGMITAPLVSMLLIPVMYYLWYRRRL